MMCTPGSTIAALLGLFCTAAASRADGVDVSPLVNDHTLAVARVDVSKVNLPAAVAWARRTLSDANVPNPLIDTLVGKMGRELGQVQPVIDAAVKAGVTQAAFVINVDAQGFRAEPHVLMMIATADPDAVSAALKPLPFTTTDLDGVTVWSSVKDGDYVHQIVPSPRPELTGGIDNPAAAVIVAAGGIAEARRAELLKDLPARRDPFGLPPALSLFSNVTVVRARLDATGGPHVTIAADTKDPAALAQWLDQMKASPQTVELAKSFPVTTAGQTTTLDVHQPELRTIASALTPALERIGKQAVRVQSMSNMRQLLLAGHMYAAQNHGAPPSSLDKLGTAMNRRDGVTPPQLLTNPQRPELGAAGYVFVPVTETDMSKIRSSADRVAIYEAGDFGEGVNVGFWDGHVEFISDATRFKALLAASQPPDAKPATP